ncbi:hypothetical protein FK515_30310 [Klebsiella pneumoniae]|nr:hypothetical protein [Klebsiella pneumoniae]
MKWPFKAAFTAAVNLSIPAHAAEQSVSEQKTGGQEILQDFLDFFFLLAYLFSYLHPSVT